MAPTSFSNLHNALKFVTMPTNKRLGLVTMTIGVFFAFASILLSTGWRPDIAFLPLLAYFLRLQLLGGDDGYLIDVPTKYALLVCMLIFAVGFLAYVGAAIERNLDSK